MGHHDEITAPPTPKRSPSRSAHQSLTLAPGITTITTGVCDTATKVQGPGVLPSDFDTGY